MTSCNRQCACRLQKVIRGTQVTIVPFLVPFLVMQSPRLTHLFLAGLPVPSSIFEEVISVSLPVAPVVLAVLVSVSLPVPSPSLAVLFAVGGPVPSLLLTDLFAVGLIIPATHLAVSFQGLLTTSRGAHLCWASWVGQTRSSLGHEILILFDHG